MPFSLPLVSITGTAVWILFAFVALACSIATMVLEYHWKNYAIDAQKINSVRFLYRAGLFFLLTIIFLTALSYSIS